MGKAIYHPKGERQKTIIKLLNSLEGRYSRWDIWQDFIVLSAVSIANAFGGPYREQREAMYLERSKKYSTSELEVLAQMLAEVVDEMEQNPDQDMLGELFMALGLANEWKGQFFTPYHICRAMAAMNLSEDLKSQIEEKGWVSVSDPACGAGALLLAFANECKRNHINYRTTPTTRLKRIVTELLERGCVLDGVPGFYCQKETGQWTLDIRGSGIMIPDRNYDGQIEAIQVRLDRVYNQKFYNLTSVDKYYGTPARCCPHYVGVQEGDEVVCVTEGVMKADLAYHFALGSQYECGFAGLTGVPSYSQYERLLQELSVLGVQRLNIMIDSDYQDNDKVRTARDRYIELGAEAGFEVAPITWSRRQKGIDDLYKHLFRSK